MKRRRFGNVRCLPSGRFHARYRTQDGWRNAPHTFALKSRAEEWLTEMEQLVLMSQDARESLTGDNTFDEWADLFLRMPLKRSKESDEITTSEKAHKTKVTYESVLRLHVRPFFGHMRVADISVPMIQIFQDSVEEKLEHKHETHAKAQDYARWVLNLAVTLEGLKRNPYAHPTITMPNRKTRRTATPLEENDISFLTAAMHENYRLVPFFTAYTGLRAGEVWALRRRSVNVLRKELYVTHSVGEQKGKGLVMGPTKSGLSRTVDLPQELVDLLVEHMASRPGGPDDWLFPTVTGKQTRHPNFMVDYFGPAKIKAKVPARTIFHDLRHFCAHYYISMGYDKWQIMELLGHRSIDITMGIYGGFFRSKRREMADLVNEAMKERRVTMNGANGTPEVSRVATLLSLETVPKLAECHEMCHEEGVA